MKVILIGIDGLMLNRAIDSGRANKLKELKESGFHVEMQVAMPTVSGPSWSTLLTGKTIEIHKVIDNYFQEHNLKAAPDFLTKARQRNNQLITYAAAGWPPLVDLNDVGPVIADNEHLRFARDGETHGYLKIDKEVFDHALETIRNVGPDLSFVYFCGADEAGHRHGTLYGPYFDAIERINGYVEELHRAITERSSEYDEKWLLVLTTDHGHRDEGGHGGDSQQERASFVIASGIGCENPNWNRELKPEDLAELLISHL